MKKNILFIMTDQQQATAMSCADTSYKTPHLDRLARMGVRFTSNISTSAQCTPSRASLQTGRFPHQLGMNQIGYTLDPKDTTVGQVFAQQGYETVYFGKWHLGNLPLQDYGYQVTDYRSEGADLTYANPNSSFKSHQDCLTTQKAIHYLNDYDETKQPFFMTVSLELPHPNAPEDPPFEWIKGFEAEFKTTDMPVPESYYADDLSSKPAFQQERSQMAECSLTEEKIRRDAHKYRTMLMSMDYNLGRLLGALEENGLMDDTVILFTSDHGDMQGAHRMRLKGVLPYRELYNTPLLLCIPGSNTQTIVCDDLVSSAAIPGTLLDAAGIEIPDSFEGGTLLPLLDRAASSDASSEANSENTWVFFEHYKAYWGYHPFRAVQSKRWKYIYYYEENLEEMYDLLNDPNEMHNIAQLTAMDSNKQGWREKLDQWWEHTGALQRKPLVDPTSNW